MKTRSNALWIGAVSFVLIGLLLPMPAEAQARSHTCRASALRVKTLLLNLEPVVANPADDPCQTDSKSLVNIPPVLGISAAALTAQTNIDPSPTAIKPVYVEGGATDVQLVNVLNLVNLSAQVLKAEAETRSISGSCFFFGKSTVANANILGLPIANLTTPKDIPVLGVLGLEVAVIHLNATLGGLNPTFGPPNDKMLTQRALWLEVKDPLLALILSEVVVGEATVDRSGNPCRGTF